MLLRRAILEILAPTGLKLRLRDILLNAEKVILVLVLGCIPNLSNKRRNKTVYFIFHSAKFYSTFPLVKPMR